MNFKSIFYDLGGLNQYWFGAINGFTISDSVAWVITELGNRHYIGYWLAAVAIAGIATWLIQQLRGEARRVAALRIYAVVLGTMLLGYAFNGVTIGALKSHFSYPRPFVEMGVHNVHYAGEALEESEYYRSFPSGHAAFITLMVASLWPLLATPLARLIGGGVVLAVMWSRIALGVHYPMDVMVGTLLGLINAFIAALIITHALLLLIPPRAHAQ